MSVPTNFIEGGKIGNLSVCICILCGCVIMETAWMAHNDWHRKHGDEP